MVDVDALRLVVESKGPYVAVPATARALETFSPRVADMVETFMKEIVMNRPTGSAVTTALAVGIALVLPSGAVAATRSGASQPDDLLTLNDSTQTAGGV